MGIFDFLFGKRQRRDPGIPSIVSQASNAIQQHASMDEQRQLAEGVEQTMQELIKANQLNPSGQTLVWLETSMIAVAQSIGLMVWERFGHRLSEEICVQLAQAFVIMELYNQQSKIPSDNKTHEWYDKAITQQVLARQASTPVLLSFMGQEKRARLMVEGLLTAAQIPDEQMAIMAMKTFMAEAGL